MNWREEIKKFIVRRSETGDARSYVDVKGMIGRPDLLFSVVAEIGELILRKHSEIKAIGSHGVGGTFLIGPTILYVYDHWFNVNGFFVRLDARENGSHHAIEGCVEKGSRVLLIDDLIETGNSSLKARDILVAHGCQMDGIVVVVDLSNGDNACTRAGIKVEPLTTL
ncbi:hypothetical protein HZA56_13455 [Candidatus Poribacteria bacterium]|nr:hypothetical protein [Candidatus Poribacteria bacterium]